MTTVLKLDVPRQFDAEIEAGATLDTGGRKHRLWWRFPTAWEYARTAWADSFVVGMLFLMMEARREVRIEGNVSPSLLENLERYMAIWRVWDPKRYAVVPMRADHEEEMPAPSTNDVLASFSGGVDSCYTLARHLDQAAGRGNRRLGAAVVMHGFDIWPDQENAAGIFAGMVRETSAQLAATPVPVLPISTNFHELPVLWADAFGSQLVSGLMLFAGRFRGTLLPNNQSYHEAAGRWGSTPLTDPHLGSRNFPILDDGGEVLRSDKIEYLARWPALLDHLRVCFPAHGCVGNCCHCEKCLRTILAFHVAGIAIPRAAFPHPVTMRQIAGMKFHSQYSWHFWRELLLAARQKGMMREPWAKALATAVRRGARRHRWQQLKQPFIPCRNCIRAIFRASPRNGSQLNW